MCSLLSVGGIMTVNENIYIEIKNKLIALNKNGLISNKQLDCLLDSARKKLGLFALTKSIYL